MKNVFSTNDVLVNEMDNLLGGFKAKWVKEKKLDGTETTTLVIEW